MFTINAAVVESCKYDYKRSSLTGFDTKSTKVQSLIFLTIPDGVLQYIPIYPSGEQVNPFNDSEGDKIKLVLVSDFVFSVHRVKSLG